MNLELERNTRLFNTPLEISLRTLFILTKFFPKDLELETLIYLDYFAVHSNDLRGGPQSLHPKYPFRSSEIVVKRDILQKGLIYLISKELVEIKLADEGIKYAATNIGRNIISLFDSRYAKGLSLICNWLFERFYDLSENDLKKIVDTNIEKWGGEFSNEARFRSI